MRLIYAGSCHLATCAIVSVLAAALACAQQARPNPSSDSLDAIRAAIRLEREGKTRESVAAWKQALAQKKDSVSALTLLGMDYCQMQDYASATPILKEAANYFDDDALLTTLAPCYLEAGEPIYGVLAYQRLFDKSSADKVDNAANLIRACWRASRSYTETLEKMPGAEVYNRALQTARDLGPANARREMQRALQAAPYLTPSVSFSGLASLFREHAREPAFLYVVSVWCGETAIAMFQFLEDHYSSSTAFRMLHADLMIFQGSTGSAIAEYEQLLKANPDRPDLHHNLAVLCLRAGEWERALSEYRLESKSSSKNLRALAGISECLLYLGRYQEDLQLLTPLVASGEAPEWALLDAGSVNQHLGRMKDAVSAYVSAEELNPANTTTRYHLMHLYKEIGRNDLSQKETAQFYRLKAKSAKEEARNE